MAENGPFGIPFLTPKIPEKVYVGPLFASFPRKWEWDINCLLGAQNRVFWVGAKKLMLKKFMCFFGPLILEPIFRISRNPTFDRLLEAAFLLRVRSFLLIAEFFAYSCVWELFCLQFASTVSKKAPAVSKKTSPMLFWFLKRVQRKGPKGGAWGPQTIELPYFVGSSPRCLPPAFHNIAI